LFLGSLLSTKEWADLLNGGAGGMDEYSPYWLDADCIDEYLHNFLGLEMVD